MLILWLALLISVIVRYFMYRKNRYPKQPDCSLKHYKGWREQEAIPFYFLLVGFVIFVIWNLSFGRSPTPEEYIERMKISSGVFFMCALATIIAMVSADSYRKYRNILPVKSKGLIGIAKVVGAGVVQNDAEAVNWYRLPAEEGDAMAQNFLAASYASGNGVIKNEIEAYKWYLLAGAQGNAEAKKGIKSIEKILSPEQRAEGQRLAVEWQEEFEMDQADQ